MTELSEHKRGLRAYFDGAGYERWAAIYGQARLESRVRRTIRAGHSAMLEQALAWLDESLAAAPGQVRTTAEAGRTTDTHPAGPVLRPPSSVAGRAAHVLDAGCGTGLLTLALAGRGHRVTAVDLAPQMAAATAAAAARAGLAALVDCSSGDLEQVEGRFDAVCCLDVLVHYPRAPFAQMLARLAGLARGPLIVTYAPHSPLLAALHWLGGRFPRPARRTEIQMIPEPFVRQTLALAGLRVRRSARISRGFYHVALIEAARPEGDRP